jgi:hypothetical protein
LGASGKLRRQANYVLGQTRKLWIWAGASEDIGVAFGDHAATFALECLCDHSRTAASSARNDGLIDEFDKVVG